MKRVIAALLLLCLAFGLCACQSEPEEIIPTRPNATPITEPTEDPNAVVIPEVQLVINLDKDDTDNDLRVFPANRLNNQQNAYIHIYVTSEKDTESIRLRLDKIYGKDDQPEGDFKVANDLMYEVPTNEWYRVRMSITATNVYFNRITLYYGETETMLTTKTIYTPYKNPCFGEEDFEDTVPEFHAFNGLNTEEQALFDKCQYAVAAYAAADHYLSVKSFEAWQGAEKLYLRVKFELTDGEEEIWFAIDNGNLQSYVTSTKSEDVIPEGEGTSEQEALYTFFYVRKALTNAITA